MRFIKGPYLQDAKTDAITIMWETNAEAKGIVKIYKAMMTSVPRGIPVEGEPIVFTDAAATLHKVTITGLSAGTDYYYEIFDGEGTQLCDKIPFRTSPDDETAISFILTSEHGGANPPYGPYTKALIERMAFEHPDFIQSVGDITRDGRNEEEWDLYLFRPFADLLRTTPFYPCVGNHEIGTNAVPDREIDRYENFHKYFAFPHYYSYDYGCAHFCVLDSSFMVERNRISKDDDYISDLKEDFMHSEQVRFLEEDLAKTDKKWKFVVFHYPPYTSSIYDVPELKCLCPIFEKYGVDIVFNSHAIVYERSHPITAGKVSKDGVRYILVGGFGKFDSWFRTKSNGRSAKLSGVSPNYVRIGLSPYRLELQAIDIDGKLFDTLVLEKD